jgi:hypothetical protein
MLGASSLFVYWIHVEMVYGLPSFKLRQALAFTQGLAAYVVLCVGLIWLVRAKNGWMRARTTDRPAMSRIEPGPATH